MTAPESVGEPAHGITVAVIVATFNRADFLPAALDSILAQTRPPDEVIVVDDGSTDDTAAVLSGYADRLTVLRKTNAGKSSALNLGLAHVCSTHVQIFDDDDIVLREGLAKHVDFLTRHPEYDFSYSPCYYFSGEFAADALDEYLYSPLPSIGADHYLVSTLEDLRGSMQGMLIPKRCYDAVGGFDDTMLRTQDHEMVIRLARRFRAGRLDSPTYAHRQHDRVRGPNAELHDGADRLAVWRQYQRRIFTRLREELALCEYLPGSTARCDAELTPLEYRRALLQRTYVMANRGLYDEALADLGAGLSLPTPERTLSVAERRLLSALTMIPNMRFMAPAKFFRQVGAVIGRRPDALAWLYRGLYWAGRKHIARPVSVVRIGCAAAALSLGFIGGWRWSATR